MKTADAKTRDKLKAVRDELQTKRADRSRLRGVRDQARDAFGEADFANDTDITQTKEFKDAEQAVAAVGHCEDNISSLENAESAILRLLGSDENNGAGQAAHSHTNGSGERSHGWNGHAMLADSENYHDAKNSGVFTSDAHFGTITLGRVSERENFASFISPNFAATYPTAPATPVATPGAGAGTGLINVDQRGIQGFALRPLTLFDVVPVGTTDSNMIQYVQVTGVPGYAAETAEGTLKPQEGITFLDATAPVRTIAGYIKMNRQAMDDAAGLATLVNTLLPYDVRRRLESQMLQGDGSGQNLTGILNTSGIGAPASVTGDNIMDGILRAITTVILSDGDPTWVAMNPLTYQSMAIMKSSGSGEYMLEEPGGGPESHFARGTVWGLTPIRNRLMPQATPLVGDWSAATLLVREGVNVKTSDADQDDFIRNRVTVLAETRVAWPIWRPAGFAKAPLG